MIFFLLYFCYCQSVNTPRGIDLIAVHLEQLSPRTSFQLKEEVQFLDTANLTVCHVWQVLFLQGSWSNLWQTYVGRWGTVSHKQEGTTP